MIHRTRGLWTTHRDALLVGGALLAFDVVGAVLRLPHPDYFEPFAFAPLYSDFSPRVSPAALPAIALVAVAVLLVSVAPRLRAWQVVAGSGALLYAFAAAVNVARGTLLLAEPWRGSMADYPNDVPLVRAIGLHRFVTEFPRWVPQLRVIHSTTHPPGPLVGLTALDDALHGHVFVQAAVLAALGALVVVPMWFLVRTVAGEPVARLALPLFAVTPSVAHFTFTSVDAVLATALVTCAALVAAAVERDDPRLGAVAGLACAGALFLTYAVVFVAVFGVLYGARKSPRVLGAAAGAGLAGIALLRVAAGWDLVASYRAVPLPVRPHRRYAYWLAGTTAGFLTGAGVVTAAVAVKPAIRMRAARALLVPLVLFSLLPPSVSRLLPGEAERTWLFALPLLVAAAAARYRDDPRALRLLVVAAGVQAVVLQWLVYDYW